MSDKLREAAQAALSAMDYMLRNGEWYCAEERANALRAALAEPAIKESLTVAEPVAWTTMPEAEDWCFVSGSKDPTGKLEGKWFPLYTAPPRREWVGLTREDLAEILANCDLQERGAVAWMVEAKLREKNGG